LKGNWKRGTKKKGERKRKKEVCSQLKKSTGGVGKKEAPKNWVTKSKKKTFEICLTGKEDYRRTRETDIQGEKSFKEQGTTCGGLNQKKKPHVSVGGGKHLGVKKSRGG